MPQKISREAPSLQIGEWLREVAKAVAEAQDTLNRSAVQRMLALKEQYPAEFAALSDGISWYQIPEVEADLTVDLHVKYELKTVRSGSRLIRSYTPVILGRPAQEPVRIGTSNSSSHIKMRVVSLPPPNGTDLGGA